MNKSILLIIAILFAHTGSDAQSKNTDSLLKELMKKDESFYNLIQPIKNKDNTDKVYPLVEKIMFLLDNNKNSVVVKKKPIVMDNNIIPKEEDFFKRNDIKVFEESISKIGVPDSLLLKLKVFRSIQKLKVYNGLKNPDEILKQYNDMFELFNELNDVNSIEYKIRKSLKGKQQDYALSAMEGFANIASFYIEVKESCNESCISKDKIEKLRLEFKQPIQQAYIRTLKPNEKGCK